MIAIENIHINQASCDNLNYAGKYYIELDNYGDYSHTKFVDKNAQVIERGFIKEYTRPDFYFDSLSDALRVVALYLEKPKTAEEQLDILKKKWKEFKSDYKSDYNKYVLYIPKSYVEIDEILG